MSSSSEKSTKLRGSPLRRIPKRVVIWTLTALFAFDVLFYVFAVLPLESREIELQAKVVAIEQSIALKRRSSERLEAVVARAEKAGEEGAELIDNFTFKRRTTYSNLLTLLGEAAQEAGVEMRETDYDDDPVAGSDGYGMISIRANFRGQYENLVKFLNVIDRSERFLIIGSLGATPRESGDLQIVMRIDTFMREI